MFWAATMLTVTEWSVGRQSSSVAVKVAVLLACISLPIAGRLLRNNIKNKIAAAFFIFLPHPSIRACADTFQLTMNAGLALELLRIYGYR